MDRVITKSCIFNVPKETLEEDGSIIPCEEYCRMIDGHCDECPIQKSFDKLKHYEDLEEQGLLLKLPCAEGTIVYIIKNNTECCAECNYFEEGCYDCEDMCRKLDGYPCFPQYADEPICEKQFFEVFKYKPNIDWIFNNRKLFGKTIFLTKEEAETKLQELQNGVTQSNDGVKEGK